MAHTDFLTALQGSSEIEITVTGRTSGRSLSYPIWFALEGEKLYLIPVKGSDTEWYKNLHKRPSIRLTARGKTFTTSATPITDEAIAGSSAVGRCRLEATSFQHRSRAVWYSDQVQTVRPSNTAMATISMRNDVRFDYVRMVKTLENWEQGNDGTESTQRRSQ